MPGEVNEGELRGLVERIETIEEEIVSSQNDRKDVYAEAKSLGYSTKIIRAVVALRKMEREKRQEMQTLTELYSQAVGLA